VPLKLIPPGRRKSPYYVVRGRLLGVDIETSTKTSDPQDAIRFKNELERNLLDSLVPSPGAHVTFHRAADLYVASKIPPLSAFDKACVERLKTGMPDKPLRAIGPADIAIAAKQIYPGHSPDSIGRMCYAVAGAIMHYAAENKWCEWMRLKHPKKKEPETRFASDDTMTKLLAATEVDRDAKRLSKRRRYLLVLWLFRHGTRIGGALSIDCSRLDLERKTYTLYISKSRIWREFPMDDEVHAELIRMRDLGDLPDSGKLFPWSRAVGVRVWMHPICKRLGVKFTPHMARHRLGKKLDEAQAGLRTIMMALGQTNARSAMRYVGGDMEVVREKLGKVSGKR
jgi:integrase